ncbi:hypothetical protein WK43_26935 [Burkholderia ubonensis]|nr:hypothetical protein WK37_26905 [Burkholderia ubonensis]KVS42831.1 hypothetical protein WK38_26385 [Burkholderia ubonensis]KVS67871.1 hypothetical protein WK42_31425 [Burkholderia ubonensis]KVS81383.1 hypothetical protein WK43_26935 [Burkholderia ubonensis]KVS86603.1 hypothetical protein WK44_19110 [Burkholderia ubonensis]
MADGLKGLAEAIGAAYPRTAAQTCIVHLIRNCLEYALWKDRKAVAQRRRNSALQAFADAPWGERNTRTIVQSWQCA